MPYILRPAIAMIELIFAIVIMGIVLLSAPTLIGVSSQSTSTATFQESIHEVASLVNLITTRYWDENDFNNTSPILHTATVPTSNDFPGKISRKETDPLLGNLNATDTNAADINLENDMDDFNGDDINISIAMAGEVAIRGEDDYIDIEANLATQVQYGKAIGTGTTITINEPFSPTLGGATTHRNTKVITVTLSSINFPDKNVSLSTFACNIGSFKTITTGVNR